jgi:UDPglucose 6-dehydrogenase
MKVSVIGTGYVGLVTGVCLAEKGHEVTCVDLDPRKVENINRCVPPIYEPGLPELLQRNGGKRLRATTDLRCAVMETELSFIAVGTPSRNGEIDLRYVQEAARQVGRALREKDGYHLVIMKSTVVPGTTEQTVIPLLEETSGKKAGRDFGVAMNPEFLTEGEAVQDFMFPDRIVLGGIDERSIGEMDKLYAAFPDAERVRCSPKTAEMIKYASNCLLATLISFSNEFGNLCTALSGVDIADVMKGLHLSKYFTSQLPGGERVTAPIVSFLWAGCGFGGSCLPKDVRALIAHGARAGQPMQLLESVLRINEQQPRQVLDLLRKHYPQLQGVRVAVLGMAFRPQTSDMRESPALPIIRDLLAEGAQLKAYDPTAREEARKIFADGELQLCESLAEAIAEAQAIVLVTRWDEFRNLPELLRHLEPSPLLIDGRRMLDQRSFAKYEGVGR